MATDAYAADQWHRQQAVLVATQYAPARCTPVAAVQLQPIPYACGDQRALLPIAVGAMNINELMNLTTYATNASPPQYSHAPVS